jgi:MFS transporter, DHA1 family, multidrug resistance protein
VLRPSAGFAYVSGSPLFLINAAGFDPRRYGLLFAATSLAIMLGAFLNGQFSARGVGAASLVTAGAYWCPPVLDIAAGQR